jgi:hypothetical protein
MEFGEKFLRGRKENASRNYKYSPNLSIQHLLLFSSPLREL